MSPRHFANYRSNDPEGYKAFSDSMHNTFVSITHKIGLGKFFSFTPAVLPAENRAGSKEKPQSPKPIHKDLYK
jgi:hypothetical protein